MFDEIPDEATGSNNALPDAPWVIKEREHNALLLLSLASSWRSFRLYWF
jgi:hypothetical protein